MSDDQWAKKLALYDELVRSNTNFERLGKTLPYTSANGHMFSQLNKKGELGIRLPKEMRTQFIKEYKTTLFTAYGTIMQEYVLIPEKMFENMEVLSSYLNEGYKYVSSLKPKKA